MELAQLPGNTAGWLAWDPCVSAHPPFSFCSLYPPHLSLVLSRSFSWQARANQHTKSRAVERATECFPHFAALRLIRRSRTLLPVSLSHSLFIYLSLLYRAHRKLWERSLRAGVVFCRALSLLVSSFLYRFCNGSRKGLILFTFFFLLLPFVRSTFFILVSFYDFLFFNSFFLSHSLSLFESYFSFLSFRFRSSYISRFFSGVFFSLSLPQFLFFHPSKFALFHDVRILLYLTSFYFFPLVHVDKVTRSIPLRLSPRPCTLAQAGDSSREWKERQKKWEFTVDFHSCRVWCVTLQLNAISVFPGAPFAC